MSKDDVPRHGTRSRYRRLNCRCVACQRGSHNLSIPSDLRWPFRRLEKIIGRDIVAAWYSQEQISDWRINGLKDEDADRVSISLGKMPHEVWDGWISSGLDFPQYP